MNIEFPSKSAYDSERMAVAFPVVIDGKQARALVSLEALEDHFGLQTGPDPVQVFEQNRTSIEPIARALIDQGITEEILIKTSMFGNL